MFRYLVLVCVATHIAASNANVIHANEIVQDKELVLAFVINRHGERTPDADELSLSNEQEKIKNLTYLEGLEGLTNVGKRRAYQVGKYIRQRYGADGFKLISNLYLQDEIAIRSTDKERTKMTVLVAMSAVYPPEVEQQWDEGLGKVWQPVPYTAVPLKEDFLRYYANCDKFTSLMAKAKQESLAKEFVPYKDLMKKLKQETGGDYNQNPLLFQTLLDLFRSQSALGIPIPAWAKPIMPKINEAARLAYSLYSRFDEMKKIGGGVLLNQFIEAASELTSGKPVNKPLRIFSGHDFNIGSLIDVAKVVKEDSIPEYGAVFSLELYKSKRNGALTVEPVYLSQAGESEPKTLSIAGCGATCDFKKFKELTKEYVLPEDNFYKICGIKTEL